MKLLLHQDLNCVTCFCGEIVYGSHCCDVKLEGVKIEQCENSCDLCKKERQRQNYEEQRWWKDRDGYLHCGYCGEKMNDDVICSSCFCFECHEEKDDKEEDYCEKCYKSVK